MARCARGDRRAMDVLVHRYHGKLLDFAFRHLRDREASADIAQAVLVKVFENAANYRQTASFKTWLYKIALNAIRDECRRRNVRKESIASQMGESGSELEEPSAFIGSGRSDEDSPFSQMAAAMVWETVDELREEHRSAVLLRFRQGLTCEEIADVMGTSSGTVRSWIHYALKRLRVLLEPAHSED